MKYCDKWVVSNTEPKADALWVQPIKEQKDSINVKAFVDGRWKSAGGGFTVPEGGIPLKDLDKSTQEAIDPIMASYNEYSKQYFTTEYVNNKKGAIYFKSNVSSAYLEEISYSINGGEWVTVKNGAQEDDDDGGLDHIYHRDIKSAPDINALLKRLKNPTPSGKKGFELVGFDIGIPVESGDIIRWKGKGKALAQSMDMDELIYSYFDCMGYYKVYGNVSSLLYGDDFENEQEDTTPYKYAALFASTLFSGGNNNLVDASNLVLPSKVSMGDFMIMFGGCTNLVNAPKILPATTLAAFCYTVMFTQCAALVKAPELPATILADQCYNGMFSACTSLTTAPELPSATLAEYCYMAMFSGCTSLNYIKFLSLSESSDYTSGWVRDVPPGGTFIQNDNMNIPVSESGIPSGWAVYHESDRMDEPVKKYEQGNVIEIYPEGDAISVGANSSYIVMDQPTGEFTINLPTPNPQREEKINIALVTGDTAPSISFLFTDDDGNPSPALIEYGATFETSSKYLIECVSLGEVWFVKWKKYTLSTGVINIIGG